MAIGAGMSKRIAFTQTHTHTHRETHTQMKLYIRLAVATVLGGPTFLVQLKPALLEAFV